MMPAGAAARHAQRSIESDWSDALRPTASCIQKLPSERRYDNAAAYLHCRQADSEEPKDVRSDEHGAKEEKETVDRDLKRHTIAPLSVVGSGEAQEQRRTSDRIDDGKQRGIYEQERVNKGVHAAPLSLVFFSPKADFP